MTTLCFTLFLRQGLSRNVEPPVFTVAAVQQALGICLSLLQQQGLQM